MMMADCDLMPCSRRNFLKGGVGVLSASGAIGVLAEKPRNFRTAPKSVQDEKLAMLAKLHELGPTITDYEVCRKTNIPGKCAAFYIDDVIWVFRDLAAQKPKPCWGHCFLGHIKEAWERYGVKTQLNIFYRDDFYYGVRAGLFTLKDMPDIWRDEFQAAKEWLRFGFHSIQEFPDYPWISASYDDVKLAWEMLTGEVERFAGPGMWAKAVTPHWGPISKDGCIALKDCGAKVVWVSRGKRWEYTGDQSILPYGHAQRIENHRKPESAIYWRGGSGDDISVSASGYNHLVAALEEKTRGTYNWIYDKSTGVNFKQFTAGDTCLNLYSLDDITTVLALPGEPEFYCYATHEEYFHKDYFAYQSDYCQKTLVAAKWMHDHGYRYIFIEDSVD